ncbi:MAG: class II aldolase, partial [Boseongicola sp. SB0662_bin_57]|nr:class II aldolase [Boseongicola sp. SB0662_bin_57]
MSAHLEPPDSDFRALSARLGKDPLQVQGPGGNTSVKDGDVMWIKA